MDGNGLTNRLRTLEGIALVSLLLLAVTPDQAFTYDKDEKRIGAAPDPAAERRPPERGALPINATVITSQELQDGVYGYDLFDVLAALRLETGITVKSSSDIGSEDWLLIGGFPRDSSRNVLVLIDGMPLNDAATESNEFDHLPPIELIDRIVVYRPPLPARFGGYHSAIEVITKNPVRESHGELSVAYGGRDSVFGSAFGQAMGSKAGFLGIMDFLRTDNLTGQTRTEPRQLEVYGDRSYSRLTPAGKFVYFGDAWNLAVYGQHIGSEKFFSDELFRDERERRERGRTSFNVNTSVTPWKGSQLRFNVFHAAEDYKLNLQLHPDFRHQDRYKQGFRVNWAMELPRNQSFAVGGELTNTHAEEAQGSALRNLQGTRFYAAFAEYNLRPSSHLDVIAGLRWDEHAKLDPEWNPSFRAVFRPYSSTILHATWGSSTRWPSLDEFDTQDPFLPVLAERLSGFDAGWRQTLFSERMSIGVGVFDLELENEARFVMDFRSFPPFFGYRPAQDTVRSRGVEVQADFRLNARWSAFANYTFTDIERRPSGEPVDFGPPKHLGNVGVHYASQPLNIEIVGRGAGQAEGVQSMGAAPKELAGWFVLDAALRWRLKPQWEIRVRGSN